MLTRLRYCGLTTNIMSEEPPVEVLDTTPSLGVERVIVDQEALAALQAGDKGKLKEWYDQRLPEADKTLENRIALEARMAEIQHAAGEDSDAIATLKAAQSLAHASGLGEHELMFAKRIEQLGGK